MSVPAQIGTYKLEQQIGRGASSEVWLGRHVLLRDHVVAIKVLMSQDQETVRRFQREAAIAARLRHSCIVRLYDFGRANPFYYALMEYIEGSTLRQLIARRVRLPLEEASAIFSQIALALDYAHSLNVVHRDISPANILCEERTGRALLTDFGIAREPGQPITVDQLIMGTPGYLSPEHAQSAASVTHLSDIFGLGVVLYQMLAGELPWAEPPTPAKPTFSDPIPLRERGVKDVPADVERVLKKLLAIDPSQRFPTAGAAVEELRRLLDRHQTKTQVVQLGAPNAGRPAVEFQAGGVEPNEVEAALGPDLKRAVIDRAHARAAELCNPAVIAALLDDWAAQDRLRRRPLLGRLARLHKVTSRNVYFYTLRVLYERRTLPEDEEEPDRKPQPFQLEPDVERWEVKLPPVEGFVEAPGGRVKLPGSTRVVVCKGCMGKGATVCPKCEGKQRIYVTRPAPAAPAAAPYGRDGASAQAAPAAQATRGGATTATAAPPRFEQALVPCPACDGRGGVTCDRCEGVGRLVMRKTFNWSRTPRTLEVNDDLPALNEQWLARTCTSELVYTAVQHGGVRPEWSLVPPIAALVAEAEARCSDEVRLAQAELSVKLIPVTDIVFDLGKPGEQGLYKLAIYGFEKLIPPDWRFFLWERVALLCAVVFLLVVVVILLVFAFLG